MNLQDIEKLGIPSRVVQAWSERQGDALLPVQSRAIRKGLLPRSEAGSDGPVRMLISAPTASGKSFCAEMAVARALTRREKAVMLVPLKALAEQKYRTLAATFAPLGVRCLIATGDHPENDIAFAHGDYQVAVAIYEKFDLLLTANLDALRAIGLLVIDEIQTISDPGRGAVLERLLTRVLASAYRPSLLGLSPVIGEAESSAGRLADWMGAVLVEETARPIDLLRGVAAEGSFRYRSYNSGLEGIEPFGGDDGSDDPFERFVERLKEDTGSTLVFLKSRRETIANALRLAAAVNWPPATAAVEALAEEEPSYLVRTLRQALSRGVAFHNADLSSRQRLIVEEAFTRHEVRVVLATTTLAMGVDLPADTVYLETVKYAAGLYDSRPTLVPVSRAEYDNMTGRAGRLGRTASGCGRAIILADTEFDRDVLWENYVDTDRIEPLTSAFSSMPVEDWVLAMTVCGLAGNPADLGRLYERSLHALVTAGTEPPDIAGAVGRLLDGDLLHTDGSDTLRPTVLGEATALTGLSAGQANCFVRAIQHRYPATLFGWIVLALSSPGWSPPAGTLSRFELVEQEPLKLLFRRYDHLVDEIRPLTGGDFGSAPLDYASLSSLKACLVLEEWRTMTPIAKIEELFQMHMGQVMALGETAAHLVQGLARLLPAIGGESGQEQPLIDLAFSLRFGLDSTLRLLQRQFGDILVRSDLAALYRAGYRDPLQLADGPVDDLKQLINGSRKFMKFNEKLLKFKQEVEMQRTTVTTDQAGMPRPNLSLRPASIEIDGSYERERYLVRINGFPVRLTGKSFKYFTRLAWSRLHRDSGWVYKEDLELGFNQARYLYRMKNEIKDGMATPWAVIENNRLGYYRLNVDPGCISINVEKLREHPDFELRSLIAGQDHRAVN